MQSPLHPCSLSSESSKRLPPSATRVRTTDAHVGEVTELTSPLPLGWPESKTPTSREGTLSHFFVPRFVDLELLGNRHCSAAGVYGAGETLQN